MPSIPSPPHHHAHFLVTNYSIIVCPCLELWNHVATRTMAITSIHPLQYPTPFLNSAFHSSSQMSIPHRFCLIGTYSISSESRFVVMEYLMSVDGKTKWCIEAIQARSSPKECMHLMSCHLQLCNHSNHISAITMSWGLGRLTLLSSSFYVGSFLVGINRWLTLHFLPLFTRATLGHFTIAPTETSFTRIKLSSDDMELILTPN